MIYIVGTKFVVGATAAIGAPKQSFSVQEAMMRKQSFKPAADSKFKVGNTYRLAHIKKIEDTLEYVFENTQSKELITQVFKNTGEADTYIAQLRNSVQELENIRNSILTQSETQI